MPCRGSSGSKEVLHRGRSNNGLLLPVGTRLSGPRPIGRRSSTAAPAGSGPGAAPDHAARRGTRRLAVLQCQPAVDDDVADAGAQLVRVLIGGVILYRVRIKDHDIGVGAGAQ